MAFAPAVAVLGVLGVFGVVSQEPAGVVELDAPGLAEPDVLVELDAVDELDEVEELDELLPELDELDELDESDELVDLPALPEELDELEEVDELEDVDELELGEPDEVDDLDLLEALDELDEPDFAETCATATQAIKIASNTKTALILFSKERYNAKVQLISSQLDCSKFIPKVNHAKNDDYSKDLTTCVPIRFGNANRANFLSQTKFCRMASYVNILYVTLQN